jgi:RNA polymerase sigma-70 factor (ECF subfamily)
MMFAAKQKRFATMVSALTRPLYRYAYWLCGDAAQAQDLLQESLMRAWRALDGLRDERAARSWLFAIVRREHVRNLTCSGIIATEAPSEDIVDGAAALDFLPDVIALRQALLRLPVQYREPLLLQAVEGLSLNEIAQMLDLPTNTVATRIFRARLRLRAMLRPEQEVAAGSGRR